MSPYASSKPTIDLSFDAEQLRAKYDALALSSQWGEHPNHPLAHWQTEVYRKITRDGYWDWVVTKLNHAKDPFLAEAEQQEIMELQAGDPGNQGA